jgi:hypothetical protein
MPEINARGGPMDGGSEAGGLTVTCMLMSNTEMTYCCLL